MNVQLSGYFIPVLLIFFQDVVAQQPNDLIFSTLASDRKIYSLNPDSGVLTLRISNTTGSGPSFRELRDVVSDGKTFYVADFLSQEIGQPGNGAVFSVDKETNERTIISESNNPSSVEFFRARGNEGIVFSRFLTETSDQLVLRITSPSLITVNLGAFPDISDIAVSLDGVIFVADIESNRIHSVNPFIGSTSPGRSTTYNTSSLTQTPSGLAFADDRLLLITDVLANSVFLLDTQSLSLSVFSRGGAHSVGSGPAFSTISDVEVDGKRRIFVLDQRGALDDQIIQINPTTRNRSVVSSIPNTSDFSVFPLHISQAKLTVTPLADGTGSKLEWDMPPRFPHQIYRSQDLSTWTPVLTTPVPSSIEDNFQVPNLPFLNGAKSEFFRIGGP